MEEYVVSLGTFIHPAPKYFYTEGYKRCKKNFSQGDFYYRK